MDLGLNGRVALVTGASRGIGRAVAEALDAEGARVALVARDADALETLRASCRDAHAFACDLTDVAATDAMLTQVRATLGAPTILVLSAASHYRIQKLHTVSDADASAMLALDLAANERLCRRLVGDMMVEGYGRIVGIGSVAARAGVAGGTLYGVAKAGLEGLVRGISVDYARRGITANVCNVGIAETERIAARTAGDPEARARLERATATRSLPSAADIADVVTFLCSPRASAITGAVVDATAGAHLNNLW
ncbi:MAG: SDR family oxidoreductase [Sandaracinus sp.]|nr:SDR family oxidoreductase [Sandaracinus sp.]MCB9631005.1 SDR family oxidoreductase [Sandaracinus sp.]